MANTVASLALLSLLALPAVLFGQAGAPPRTVELVPAELAGVVRDTAGRPLRDAEITVPTLGRTTRSDAEGRFLLGGVVPGAHEVWLRHIGNISVAFDWTAEEGKRVEIAVTLRPLPNTLDPVRVFANESQSMRSTSMLAGVVVDSGGVPVPNAELQLIGTNRTTISAADGSFEFRHVAPGSATLRARRMGFAPAVLMTDLKDDDQRQITLRVRRLAQTLDTVNVTEASGYGRSDAAWKEFGVRERWRNNSGEETLIGPQRLHEAGGMPIEWLLRPFDSPHAARAETEIDGSNGGRAPKQPSGPSMGDEACVLENGITPRFVPLRIYSADELERIEFYPAAPPEREYTGTVEARMHRIPQCAKDTAGGHPRYYVLWLKNAR